MKIPDTVRILGKDTKIVRESRLLDGNRLIYGQARYPSAEIAINMDYPEDVQNQAFWHEVVHYISDQMQFGLSEKKVDRVATGIYAVIKDNPDLFK